MFPKQRQNHSNIEGTLDRRSEITWSKPHNQEEATDGIEWSRLFWCFVCPFITLRKFYGEGISQKICFV